MAELNSDLARIEAFLNSRPPLPERFRELATRRAEPRRRKSVRTDGAPGMAAAARAASEGSAPAQAAAPAPAPARPTGTDLSDPKNFGLAPPIEELEQGSSSTEDYRKRLSAHLAFATKVLHTSRVPAEVWREWRAFEKTVQERLRALAERPVNVEEQI